MKPTRIDLPRAFFWIALTFMVVIVSMGYGMLAIKRNLPPAPQLRAAYSALFVEKAFTASHASKHLQPARSDASGVTVTDALLTNLPVGWSIERLYDLFPRLGERRNQEGITLSGGEQQMLAIARALARDIKVLLLDEPYEGLAPVIVDEIEKTLRVIKEQGMTTVIVEQNAVRALELADRAVILDTGGIVFDGLASEVLENEELRAEYLAI